MNIKYSGSRTAKPALPAHNALRAEQLEAAERRRARAIAYQAALDILG